MHITNLFLTLTHSETAMAKLIVNIDFACSEVSSIFSYVHIINFIILTYPKKKHRFNLCIDEPHNIEWMDITANIKVTFQCQSRW